MTSSSILPNKHFDKLQVNRLKAQSIQSNNISSQTPSFLFSAVFNNATFDRTHSSGTLTITKSDTESVIQFTDRPFRQTDYISFDDFVSLFSTNIGSNTFEEDPPNGVLVHSEEQKTYIITLLTNDSNSARFNMELLPGETHNLNTVTGRMNLFVDKNDLSGKNFNSLNLINTNFSYSILLGATFINALLTNAIFNNANLFGANLTKAKLAHANLTEANLIEATLTEATLTKAYLFNAILKGANLTGANLTGAILTGANLTGANLTGAILTGANLSYANFKDSKGIFDVQLSSASFLTGIILSGLNFNSGSFNSIYLNYANFTGANLNGSDLQYATLTGANFTGANLNGSDLQYATLTGAKLTDAILTNADLSYANLTDANFTGANLTDAKLTGAHLTDANLRDATLTGANLTDAIINNTIAPNGAKVNNINDLKINTVEKRIGF